MVRLVCLSDTHGLHGRVSVPDGDILIHAGDFTRRGARAEVEGFARFLGSLPHRHRIVVAGNHDRAFQDAPREARSLLASCCTYLEDEGTTVMGVRFWGSPWQPWFFDWAFNLPRGGDELRSRWALIPDDTDALITHGPPRAILDVTAHGDEAGCELLRERVDQVQPPLHVFGHIHEAYGTRQGGQTLFVNAAICTLAYEALNPAIVVDFDPATRRVTLVNE